MTGLSVAGNQPLVSIALCTYNGALYLREQLDSLLAQREVSFEIIAVDDGSQDQTCAILHDYATRDSRFRYFVNERNLGPTVSFERAMAMCSGEFIAPSDQDDIWQSDKLASLLAAIGRCDAAYCDSDYIDARGYSLGKCVSDGIVMLAGDNPVAFLFANSVSGHALLLRRDLFERARPFPGSTYHDWWLALCAAGRRGICYVDRPLVHFRRHDSAYSPMGQTSHGSSHGAAASRAWLEQRYVLMHAYADSGLRDSDIARAFAGALRDAIDSVRRTDLIWLLWRHRRRLLRWKGVPVLDCLKMQVRLLRKLRRASAR